MGRWNTVPRPPAAPWSLCPVIWSPPLILLVAVSIIILLHSSIMLNTNKTTAATIITITIWSILLGENTKKIWGWGVSKDQFGEPPPTFWKTQDKIQATMTILMAGNNYHCYNAQATHDDDCDVRQPADTSRVSPGFTSPVLPTRRGGSIIIIIIINIVITIIINITPCFIFVAIVLVVIIIIDIVPSFNTLIINHQSDPNHHPDGPQWLDEPGWHNTFVTMLLHTYPGLTERRYQCP